MTTTQKIILYGSMLIAFAIVVFGITLKSEEEKIMRKEIASHVDVKGFSHFNVQYNTLFREEIRDSLLYYRMKTSWDNCFMELYRDDYDVPAKREYYENELIKDREMKDYLNNFKDENPDLLNKISITTCRINYLYTDETGNDKIEIFDAKFNEKHEMIAYRLNSKSDWVKVTH